MTAPEQQSIESEDGSITEAIGGPWEVDSTIYSWYAEPGMTLIRYQQRAQGGALEVNGNVLAILDARSAPGPAPPLPDPSATVEAVDVASYQPTDLSGILGQLNPRPTHVVVRLYLPMENPPQSHSIAQIQSAWACGCSAGSYYWLYRDADPRQSVRDAIALADQAGLVIPTLWVDVEEYDGTLPTVASIAAAIDECEQRQVRPGIYTSASQWSLLGNPSGFGHVPVWLADYDTQHNLDAPLPPGWTYASGKQYTSTPVDRNCFLYEVTVPPT